MERTAAVNDTEALRAPRKTQVFLGVLISSVLLITLAWQEYSSRKMPHRFPPGSLVPPMPSQRGMSDAAQGS